MIILFVAIAAGNLGIMVVVWAETMMSILHFFFIGLDHLFCGMILLFALLLGNVLADLLWGEPERADLFAEGGGGASCLARRLDSSTLLKSKTFAKSPDLPLLTKFPKKNNPN